MRKKRVENSKGILELLLIYIDVIFYFIIFMLFQMDTKKILEGTVAFLKTI
jgi:hypothetical protein